MSHASILATAFEVLDEAGHQGLSMRSLAARLGVTPMALYHHFPDRSALARGMSDVIYAKVVDDFKGCTGSPRRKIEKLLVLYYETVVQYPELTVLIFASPGEFSSAVRQINDHLTELLEETKLTRAKKRSWLEILVDFTHGSAIATATSRRTGETLDGAHTPSYRRQLGELLSCIFE
jgi:AcrR family transcriptional regulator